MSQRLYETAVAVLGPDALLLPRRRRAVDDGRWALGLLATRANSIMGGTSEIQRNDHRRAPARAAAGAAARRDGRDADVDPLDLVDPERYARDGYPHDVWTRLRAEAPVALRRAAGLRAVLGDHEARRHPARSRRSRCGSRARRGSRSRASRRAADAAVGDGRDARSAAARPDAPGRERALHAEGGARAARRRRAHRASRSSTAPRPAGASGELDFVERIAAPFPLAVIAWILGVPQRRLGAAVPLDQRGDRQGRPRVPAPGRDARARRSSAPAASCTRTSRELIEQRRARSAGRPRERADPRRDRRRAAHRGAARRRTASCFVEAGNETTRNAISGGLLAFCEHPDEWEKLRDRPGAAARRGRGDPALGQPDQPLHAYRDRGLRGARDARSAAGEQLALYFASANRDEEVFDDPFAFRVDRRPNPHLAFGFGEHFCMGAHLARVELETIFRHLLGRARVVRARRDRSSG